MLGRALVALVAVSLCATPALAQRASDALAEPGANITPTDPGDTTATGGGATGPAVDSLSVPEPPGSRAHVPDVHYPIASPEEAAAAAEDEPTIRISSPVTTRLRALDANLRALSRQGGGNVVNAVLSMLTGGLAITLGALKDDPTDWMSVYLYVYGGAAAIRGVLELALSPNPSGAAITYQHMPMTSQAQVQERLAYGEQQLEGLAEQALIARVLDASINMAAGVAVVPLYLAPNNFEISNPLDYFILIGAGVSLVSGIISLATSSSEEQRWQAYEALRERLAAEHEEDSAGDEPSAHVPETTWRLAASPSASGGHAGFHLTF